MFTAVCVVLSALGHVLASCVAVPWWSLALGFVLVFCAAAPLAGRARSPLGVAGALAAGQIALHLLFGLGQHGGAAAAGSGTRDAAWVSGLAARLLCGGAGTPLSQAEARRVVLDAGLDPTAPVPPGGPAGHGAHTAFGAGTGTGAAADGGEGVTGLLSAPMLLGHLLAALAAGLLLARGDAALSRLVRLSRRTADSGPVRALCVAVRWALLLCAGLADAGATPARVRRPEHSAVPDTGRTALQHAVIRRGPPADLALVA
ncbi:hypothetical protein ACN20G_12010 [Streptomyces sp. BI20]|uniref:hypothetical protein n=1 Tax=Streptomyces sp. BI20 TaxID=3403460 RepID=UPI003C76E862